MPPGRRTVGLGQEHPHPGPGGPDPARAPRGLARLARAGWGAGRDVPAGGDRGAGRDRLPEPGQPAGHGPGRGRRGVRAREPGLAAGPDAPAGPRGAGGGRPGRVRAAPAEPAVRWAAAAARPGRRAGSRTRPARPRRADGQPRSGGHGDVLRSTRGRPGDSGRDDRPGRAPDGAGLAAGRQGPRPGGRRRTHRRGLAWRGGRSVRRSAPPGRDLAARIGRGGPRPRRRPRDGRAPGRIGPAAGRPPRRRPAGHWPSPTASASATSAGGP